MVEAACETSTFELAHDVCLLKHRFQSSSVQSLVILLITGSFLSRGDPLGRAHQRGQAVVSER